MSKKLLFNGCSMTAGDAVTWGHYYPDIDFGSHVFRKNPHPKYDPYEIGEMYLNYITNLRKHDNLAGQINKLTGCDCTDISEDGNSNQNICMTTIRFLSELSLEERKNYHVCIGWSSLGRKVVYDPEVNNFYNVNLHCIDIEHYKNIHNYIKEAIINRSDIDHVLDYFHNIISLQSYLSANNITYTFWNTLVYVKDDWLDTINNIRNVKIVPYKHDLLFDKRTWISFDSTKEQPWKDDMWAHQTRDQVISKDNLHPNLEAVINLAKLITDRIRTMI